MSFIVPSVRKTRRLSVSQTIFFRMLRQRINAILEEPQIRNRLLSRHSIPVPMMVHVGPRGNRPRETLQDFKFWAVFEHGYGNLEVSPLTRERPTTQESGQKHQELL